MATTKAFELAQLSALTSVDASGNVTTNTSQIANASGNLTIDSVEDIILNADGADIILADDTVDFGRFKRDAGDFVIKSETVNKALIFKGVKSGSPDTIITALTLDMQNDGRAIFSENVVVAGTITGVTTLTSSGVISTSNTTTSTSASTGSLIVAGGVGVGENLYVGGNIVISGDLTVEGTSVTLNTTDLNVEDKNITLNYHASSDTSASAGGAGITIQDAVDASNDASILWNATNDEFDISHSMKIAGSVGVTNIVTNKVVKFGGTILDDSNITDTGSLITLGSNTTASANLSIGGATATTAILSIPGADTTTKPQIRFISGIGTTLADAAISTTDDSGGTNLLIGSNQYYSAGAIARFDTSRSGSAIDFGYTGNMKFYTGTGADAPTEKMRIASDGALILNNAGGDAQMYFGGTSGTNRMYLARSGGDSLLWNVSNGVMMFGTNDAERMRITSTGQVNIGETPPLVDGNNPRHVLHIGGTTVNPSYEQLSMAPGSNSGGETATTIRMANVGNDFYLTNNYYNWGTNRFDATNEGQAFFKMGEDGRFSFGGRSSATTDSPSYNAGIGYDGSISAGTSMTMVNGTGKLNVWGNSDTSDEDVELRLYDNDTDAGSAIPTIAFYKGSGTGPVRFADIRANDVLGIIMRDGSGNSLFSVGLNGNVGVTQVRHSIRPSLNLDFANSKELDSRITFYRDSIATYYDSKGVLKYANVNEPRFDHDPVTGESKGLLIEESRTNLNYTLYTEGYGNAFYQRFNAGLSPEGVYNAHVIGVNAAASYAGKLFGNYSLSSGPYTFSVYVKKIDTPNIWIGEGSGQWDRVLFNLDTNSVSATDGVGGTILNSGIRDIGNGWKRIFITVSQTTWSPWLCIGNSGPGFGATTTGEEVMWYGALLEAGTFPTSYIPSDTRFTSRSSVATYYDETGILRTAPVNGARYGYKYDGRKWVETGLILEKAATNILGYVNSGLGSNWPTDVGNVASRYIFGQEFFPVGDSTTDGDSPSFPTGGQLTSGANYCASIYVDFNGTADDSIDFALVGFASAPSVNYRRITWSSVTKQFTLNSTTVGLWTHVSQGYEEISPNIYRIWTVGTPGQSMSSSRIYMFPASNNTTAFYVGMPQIEQGNSPSSYISTHGVASATRSADVATSVAYTRDNDIVEMIDAEDVIGQQQGTVYTEWETSETFGGVFELWDSGTNGIDLRSNGFYYLNDNTAVTWGSLPGTGVFVKTALAYDTTSVLDTRSAFNGTLGTANTSNIWYQHLTKIRFGSIDFNPAYQLNGHIKNFRLYQERLTEAEITALTENN